MTLTLPLLAIAIYRSAEEYSGALEVFRAESAARGAALVHPPPDAPIPLPPPAADSPTPLWLALDLTAQAAALSPDDPHPLAALLSALHPPDLPAQAVLTLFDAARLPGRLLLTLLQRHPYLVAGGELVENDLYVPPPDPSGAADPAFDLVYRRLLDRRQERRALEQSERLYRVLVDKAPDALVMIDLDGCVRYASPSAVALYRIPDRQSVIGADIIRFLHPDSREQGLEIYHALLAGQAPPTHRLRLLRFDGSAFDADFNFSALTGPGGALEGLVAVVRDVTAQVAVEDALRAEVAERETAQEALRMAQAYNQALLDASLDFAVLLDRSGSILAINQSAAGQFERPVEALIGRPLADYLPPLSAQALYNDLETVFDTRRPAQRMAEEDSTYLRVRVDPLFDAGGSPVRAALLAQDITANHLAEQAERRRREISEILYAVSQDLTRAIRQDAALDVVLDGIRRLLPEASAHILMLDGDRAVLTRYHQPGAIAPLADIRALPPLPVKEMAGLRPMLDTLQPVLIADTAAHPGWVRVGPVAWIRSYAGAPVVSGGQLVGFITIASPIPNCFTAEHVDLLQTLAGQAAVALQITRAFQALEANNRELAGAYHALEAKNRELAEAYHSLEDKNRELAETYSQVEDRNQALIAAYDATIAGWARALELRDKETEGHSQRVVDLTMQLAARMGVRDEERSFLRWGALLHDIGKLAIPDCILLKETALDEREWKLMKMHPTLAYQMLSGIAYLQRALAIPYYHHEWWDGSGYPMGIARAEIPLSARIFAVVDAWDALTSTRPYRAAWSPWRAAGHIRALAGRQFDPAVVSAFLTLIGFE